jgi:thioredoxin reductase (NADPH)
LELYPQKPIYDIPAISVCSAEELIEALLQQIKPSDPQFHLGQEITEPQKKSSLQYTTTSPALHKRLGVKASAP